MPRGAAVIEYRGKRGVVFRVKFSDADGKQVMETVGSERDGVTRKQAEAELRERLVRVERKAYRRPAPLTFRSFATSWFEDEERKRNWKPGTVKAYRTVRTRLLDAFGPMRLGAIRPRDVAAYVASLSKKRGASVVRRDVGVLYSILKSAKAAELVESNPVEGVEQPKLPPFRPVLLEPKEVARVAGAFTNKQARVVFLTLQLTGIRRSELQGLRWSDVDLVDGVLRVRESKSEQGVRTIALSPALVDALAMHKDASDYNREGERVFASRSGGPFRAETYKPMFEKALAAAGVDKRPRPFHDARHGALTTMAATGASPIAVMTTAGHASMQTTRRYLHLAGTVFRDEAEALERRLGLSTQPSTHLSEPQRTSHDAGAAQKPEQTRAD